MVVAFLTALTLLMQVVGMMIFTMLLFGVGLMFLFGLLTGIIPALQGLQLNIVAALRRR